MTTCVCVCVCDGQAAGAALSPRPFGDGGTSALSLPERKRSDLLRVVALAGVCTYINVICINVIGALFPLQGLQPDTGVIIWKRGKEEETGVELIILTRPNEGGRRLRQTGKKVLGEKLKKWDAGGKAAADVHLGEA